MAEKSRTQKFYDSHPESNKKHIKKNNAINKTAPKKKKRAECAKERRKALKRGKDIHGKDYDHASKRFVKSSTNRGKKKSANGSKDSNARKKGVPHKGKRGKQ